MLERYQAAYNEERGTTTAPDWDMLLRRPVVAVLEEDGTISIVAADASTRPKRRVRFSRRQG